MSPNRYASKWPMRVLVALMFLVLALTVTDAWLYTDRADQANAIRLLKLRVSSDHRYITGQQKDAARAAKLKKETAQAQCRAAIAGTARANKIIRGIRKALLDLADVARFKTTKATLRADARLFSLFPHPKCDPGPPPAAN